MYKQYEYFNFDSADDRARLSRAEWNREVDLIIFDELHKMKQWKSWIKGIFDKEGVKPRLLVTGSARMTQFKKTGDSLAGRHFNYRLHPFDLNELGSKSSSEQDEIFNKLMTVGGFPEPFIKGTRGYYNRWAAGHTDMILRQDLLDLEAVRDLKTMEILISLLAERVGAPVSNASLAKLLQKDPKTIQRWLEILEDLFVIFRLPPFHKNLARAIKKEPKYYFFDTGQVRGDDSQRFENLVACSLLKELHRLNDADGVRGSLYYLKTKEGREIDFLVHFDDSPSWLIEAKLNDSSLSPNFKHFESHLHRTSKTMFRCGISQLIGAKWPPRGHGAKTDLFRPQTGEQLRSLFAVRLFSF